MNAIQGDNVNDQIPFSDDELSSVEDEQVVDDDTVAMGRARVPEPDDTDRDDVEEPLTSEELAGMSYQPPRWVVRGEQLDASALSIRKELRERAWRRGGPAGYDSLWGFVDMDPVSVVPTVQEAKAALAWRTSRCSN